MVGTEYFIDKIVVITGGGNGIGRCMVEEFTKTGAKVAVIDIAPKAIDCDFYFQGDIAEEEVIINFTDNIINKYGKVDYLINNACINRKGILSNCSYEDFLYVQKVGVVAPYMLAKLFLPYFSSGGAIVNISSRRAYMSQADTESYTAAKGGILALTHGLAVSLAGHVRVNSISPGWIDTTNSKWSSEDKAQHPVNRVGTPLDIAKMAMYLCSQDSEFITGEDITVDGGMSKLMIYHNDYGWEYKR